MDILQGASAASRRYQCLAETKTLLSNIANMKPFSITQIKD